MNARNRVKPIVAWLIVAAVIVIGFFVYRRSRPKLHLNVTPEAQRAIEKAMRH
jgi:hypothetical protein